VHGINFGVWHKEATMDTAQHNGHDPIHYFVNGEEQTTAEHKRSVHEILADAGFSPVEEYQLTRDEGHHTYTSYDEEVPLHDHERFTATFTGVTPTS